MGVKDPARAEKMAAMFRQGLTMEMIARQFEVSRQRVRQILVKARVDASEGGAAVQKQNRIERAERAKRIRIEAEHGMSLEDYRLAVGDGMSQAFRQQRRNAAARGIEWRLTFGEWAAIWWRSGKWEQRGRGADRYCMSRMSDSGPYAIGNVHIQTVQENSKEAVKKWAGKTKKNRGVFLLYPGTRLPWQAKAGKKSLGFFETEEQAVDARSQYIKSTGFRASGLGNGRGWTYRKGLKSRPYQVNVGGVNAYFATEQEAVSAYKRACAELARAA